MRQFWWVAWVLLCALIVGCSSPSPEPEGESPESTLGSDPPSDIALEAASDAPEIGTCWRTPNRTFAPDYFFDGLSKKVACDRAHALETVATDPLTEPTIASAEGYARWCENAGFNYVGASPEHWIPWSPWLFLPSREQVAEGSSWVRCDVSYPANWGLNRSQREIDFTLHQAATEHAEDLRACLNREPTQDQAFVDCDQPHRYESTGQLAIISGISTYPSANTLRKETRQCRSGLPKDRTSGDFDVAVRWDAEVSRGEVVGVCFVKRADGAVLH